MNILEEVQILTCDSDGNQTGHIEKVAAHVLPGTLHRAFSAILVDENGRVILQRRSHKKMLWPAFWSNSCCSHYRDGNDQKAQVEQRIMEELGCKTTSLERITQFQYQARFLEVGVEMEVCDIWLGQAMSQEICEDPDEIDAIAFVKPADLNVALMSKASSFTPWFTLEWPIVFSRLISGSSL